MGLLWKGLESHNLSKIDKRRVPMPYGESNKIKMSIINKGGIYGKASN